MVIIALPIYFWLWLHKTKNHFFLTKLFLRNFVNIWTLWTNIMNIWTSHVLFLLWHNAFLVIFPSSISITIQLLLHSTVQIFWFSLYLTDVICNLQQVLATSPMFSSYSFSIPFFEAQFGICALKFNYISIIFWLLN